MKKAVSRFWVMLVLAVGFVLAVPAVAAFAGGDQVRSSHILTTNHNETVL